MKRYIGQIGGATVTCYFYSILCLFAGVYYRGVITINTITALFLASISGVIVYTFLKSKDVDLYKRKNIRFFISQLIAFVVMLPSILLYIGAVWNTNALSVIIVSFITFIVSCVIGSTVAWIHSYYTQRNDPIIKRYNFLVSKWLKNLNSILLIGEIIYAGVMMFGIYIAAGWSNDTAVMFGSVKFYIIVIAIAVISMLLKIIRKSNNMIYIANIVNSVLFMIAEIVLISNPYLTRLDYFWILNTVPLVVGIKGIANKL